MTDYVNRQDGYVVNGVFHTAKKYAVHVPPSRVLEMIRAAGGADVVPLQYFIGTCERESGFTANRRAIEAPKADGSRFITDGLFQIGHGERDRMGFKGRDLFDPEVSCACVVKLARKYRDVIHAAVLTHAHNQGHPRTSNTVLEGVAADLPAYMGIAHNQGVGAVRKTIERHGMDWAAYKARNAKHPDGWRWARYGDACISGGTRWAEAVAL